MGVAERGLQCVRGQRRWGQCRCGGAWRGESGSSVRAGAKVRGDLGVRKGVPVLVPRGSIVEALPLVFVCVGSEP